MYGFYGGQQSPCYKLTKYRRANASEILKIIYVMLLIDFPSEIIMFLFCFKIIILNDQGVPYF